MDCLRRQLVTTKLCMGRSRFVFYSLKAYNMPQVECIVSCIVFILINSTFKKVYSKYASPK